MDKRDKNMVKIHNASVMTYKWGGGGSGYHNHQGLPEETKV